LDARGYQRTIEGYFYNNTEIQNLLNHKKAVQNGEISPFAAAQLLLEKYFKK
jgi:LAO/AO transport system kinase